MKRLDAIDTLGTVLLFAILAGMVWAILSPPDARAADAGPCTVKQHNGAPYAFCGRHVCVTVDNTADTIAWMSRTRTGSTTYRDVDRIVPARPIPTFARRATTSAFVAMQHGPAGPKRVTVCVG